MPTNGNRNAPSNTWTRDEEAALADWLLAQCILFQCDQLEGWQIAMLSETLVDWYKPVSNGDLAHALAGGDHAELNDAFVLWFNRQGFYPESLSLKEIRVFAELDVDLSAF